MNRQANRFCYTAVEADVVQTQATTGLVDFDNTLGLLPLQHDRQRVRLSGPLLHQPVNFSSMVGRPGGVRFVARCRTLDTME